MAFSPSIDVQYLHQLAWRPAQFAHPLWLAAVGVNPENYGYGRSRALDSALNGMLIQRRKFPQQRLPAVLNPRQQRQIAQRQRLPALCLALGVVSLQCDDYLRLRRYRQVLSPLLNDDDIQQIIWQAVSILLPPNPRALCLSRSMQAQTEAWLSRLERLL